MAWLQKENQGKADQQKEGRWPKGEKWSEVAMAEVCRLFKGNWLCDTQRCAHWVDTNKISWKLNMEHLWDVLLVDII